MSVNPPGASILDFESRRYREDYKRAFRLIRRNRETGSPTRLNQVVEWVYGADYSSTEYQRIRRFLNDSEHFKTRSTAGFVQIEPTLGAFGVSLESSVSNTQKRNTATEPEKDTTGAYPKDRVESLLEKIRQTNGSESADHRPSILRQLAIYRSNIRGTYSLFEHRVREQYLAIPNTTRFTDPRDASNSQSRFRTALSEARSDYSEGTVLTLTLDPKRFGSHRDATESIRKAKSRLLSRLSYQLGESPTQITIPDFQSKTGQLHYHVVLFGVSRVSESQNETGRPTVSTSQIQQYWDEDYDIGSQISIQPTWTRGNTDTWILHRDDSTVSLSYYLGKRIRRLRELASLDTGAIPLKHWRHALFWTYNLQYCTCSESLKDSDSDSDSDSLPYAAEWEYVGTARYSQIPTHIKEKLIICRSADVD